MASALSAFGLDFWYNRDLGLGGWLRSLVEDIDFPYLGAKNTPSGAPSSPSRKDEDLVVVEADFNGETVEHDMSREISHQTVRACVSGAALTMAIIGLWGDGA